MRCELCPFGPGIRPSAADKEIILIFLHASLALCLYMCRIVSQLYVIRLYEDRTKLVGYERAWTLSGLYLVWTGNILSPQKERGGCTCVPWLL